MTTNAGSTSHKQSELKPVPFSRLSPSALLISIGLGDVDNQFIAKSIKFDVGQSASGAPIFQDQASQMRVAIQSRVLDVN